MASKAAETFQEESKKKAFDLHHRKVINYNIDRYNTAVEIGLSRFNNLENSKRKGYSLKWKIMENLDKYLPEFESNFQRKGGKVIWANDAEEARQEVLKILKEANARQIVKSKSMTTEEIDLNECLEEQGIKSIETDLGEYIVQLLGQKPYHIV